jgi:hypothetical protein
MSLRSSSSDASAGGFVARILCKSVARDSLSGRGEAVERSDDGGPSATG